MHPFAVGLSHCTPFETYLHQHCFNHAALLLLLLSLSSPFRKCSGDGIVYPAVPFAIIKHSFWDNEWRKRHPNCFLLKTHLTWHEIWSFCRLLCTFHETQQGFAGVSMAWSDWAALFVFLGRTGRFRWHYSSSSQHCNGNDVSVMLIIKKALFYTSFSSLCEFPTWWTYAIKSGNN